MNGIRIGRAVILLLLVMLAAIFVGCSASLFPNEDKAASYAGAGGQQDQEERDLIPPDPEYSTWWEDPETGEGIWIKDGYCTIGLNCEPVWLLSPPVETAPYDTLFINDPTIQALENLGFELLFPYGIFEAGEFKLPEGMTFAQAASSLPFAFPNIAYIEPYFLYDTPTIPNDPWFTSGQGPTPDEYQWYFENTTMPGYFDVNAAAGWSIQQGSNDIVIALIDTGVLRTTSDLDSDRVTEYGWNAWGTFPPLNYNSIITVGGGYPHCPPYFPQAQSGWVHGTSSAGEMIADTNNEYMLAGGTFAGKLLPINCKSYTGSSGLSNAWIHVSLYMILDQVGFAHIPAMDPFPDYNIKVINISCGGHFHSAYMSQLLWALSMRCVNVVPAGNEGSKPRGQQNPMNFPAADEFTWWQSPCVFDWYKRYRVDTVMGVAGFEIDGRRTGSSYYDPVKHRFNWVDICAPYHGLSLNPACPGGWSGGQGTCVSAPFVSSLALLMFSEYPGMSAWQVHDEIEQHARTTPPLLSNDLPGRVDYYLALSQGGP